MQKDKVLRQKDNVSNPGFRYFFDISRNPGIHGLLGTGTTQLQRLDPGAPGTRARWLQQWLLQVARTLELVGHHLMG